MVIKDADHYMRLLHRTVTNVFNRRNPVSRHYIVNFENGILSISCGSNAKQPFLLHIDSDIMASNVYHLLKALGDEVPPFVNYLQAHGIPNLVEVVDTGATQLYNGKDYHPDGLQPL
jgi:hypothetical protein